MTKLVTILFLIILLPTDKTVPVGEFYKSTGFESFRIKLSSDNLFEQTTWSCTWSYMAKGAWELKDDTIKLHAKQIYKFIGKNKTELVDRNSELYKYFFSLNKLVFFSKDTVGQVHELGNPFVIKLSRQK